MRTIVPPQFTADDLQRLLEGALTAQQPEAPVADAWDEQW